MKTKLAALWASLKTDMADTWNRSKIFLLAIAGLIIALEFQKLKEMLLVYLGQRELKSAKKEDTALAAKENEASTQADVLVKEADALPTQEGVAQDGWEKNQ